MRSKDEVQERALSIKANPIFDDSPDPAGDLRKRAEGTADEPGCSTKQAAFTAQKIADAMARQCHCSSRQKVASCGCCYAQLLWNVLQSFTEAEAPSWSNIASMAK